MTIKRYNKSDAISYTLGATVSIELLKTHPECVRRVFFHSKLDSPEIMSPIESICAKHQIPIEYNDKAFRVLSQKDNCFVIAMFKKYDTTLLENERHVVLVEPSNMGNLGTIMRSMLGFQFDHLAIIRPGTDHFDPKVIRASMGAIFHLNIKCYDTFMDYQKAFPSRPLYPFMLDPEAQNLKKISFPKNCSLIFGNEARGLPTLFAQTGTPVRIFHGANIDSLNLPVAVSIGLFSCTDLENRSYD